MFADGRHGEEQLLLEGFAGLAACGDDVVTLGQLTEQGTDVGGFENLEVIVGGIVAEATNRRGGVEEGKSLDLGKGHYGIVIETLLPRNDEVLGIGKEKETHDAPEVVDEIRIEKGH